jgi:uncharacterized Zn finger protein
MEKPIVKLIGEDGNIFNLASISSRALKKAGQSENAVKMQKEIFTSGSYNEALQIIMKYCEVE